MKMTISLKLSVLALFQFKCDWLLNFCCPQEDASSATDAQSETRRYILDHKDSPERLEELLEIFVGAQRLLVDNYPCSSRARAAKTSYAAAKISQLFGRSSGATPDQTDWAIEESISIDGELGMGCFGIVHASRLLNADVAVKVFRTGGERQGDNEVRIHGPLHHPNVCHFIGVASIRERGSRDGTAVQQVIVLERLLPQSLQHFMDSNSELDIATLDARNVLLDICRGMVYVHACDVLHLDIKPANIMQRPSDRRWCIIDFGLAQLMSNVCAHRAGTPMYMAPELTEFSGTVGKKADVYSFGVLAFRLVCSVLNQEPTEDTKPSVFRKVLDQMTGFSELTRKCLCTTLMVLPDDRPSFSELVIALSAVDDPTSASSHITLLNVVQEACRGVLQVITSDAEHLFCIQEVVINAQKFAELLAREPEPENRVTESLVSLGESLRGARSVAESINPPDAKVAECCSRISFDVERAVTVLAESGSLNTSRFRSILDEALQHIFRVEFSNTGSQGDWKIVPRRLGRGRTSAVFEAQSIAMEQEGLSVVAKVWNLLDVVRQDPPRFSKLKRAFRADAEAVYRLQHPGICSVYCASSQREFVVVLDRMDDRLDHFLLNCHPTLHQRREIARQVCAAMIYLQGTTPPVAVSRLSLSKIMCKHKTLQWRITDFGFVLSKTIIADPDKEQAPSVMDFDAFRSFVADCVLTKNLEGDADNRQLVTMLPKLQSASSYAELLQAMQ